MKLNNRKYFADTLNNKLTLPTLHLRTTVHTHKHNNFKRPLEYFLNAAIVPRGLGTTVLKTEYNMQTMASKLMRKF